MLGLFPVLLVLTYPTAVTGQETNDLPLAKIALHLEEYQPSNEPCARVFDGFACDDDGLRPPQMNLQGSLLQGYHAYVVALDIFPTIGLDAASFGVTYDPESIDVMGWTSCADRDSSDGAWPASGTGNRLSFESCQGMVPDPTDPEGDSFVILGSFYVYAYSRDVLSIIEREDGAVVRSCEGNETRILPDGPYAEMVSLGSVGFDTRVWEPCATAGIIEGCWSGFSLYEWICCSADSLCTGWPGSASPRACETVGGIWTQVDCILRPCVDADCARVPVSPSTWGRIKAKYGN